MARFCPKCGTQADDATRFCQKCGNQLDAPAPPPQAAAPTAPAAAAPPPPPAVTTTTTAPPASGPVSSGGKGCGKVILILAIVLGLLVVLGVAGAAYLAYRAKKKVDQIHDAYKSNDIGKMAEALGGKKAPEGHDVEAMPTFPDWPGGSASLGVTGENATGGADGEQVIGSVVPLKKGLTIVTAIQQSYGDYESIKQIQSVKSDAVLMSYAADHLPAPPNPFEEQKSGATPKPGTQSEHTQRRILRSDLENAHEYSQLFSSALPLTIEGTTAIGVSTAVLSDLKTKGETNFTFKQSGLQGALGGLLGGIAKMAQQGGAANNESTDQLKKATQELEKMSKVNCQLKRTDQKTYAFPVLVNGQSTQLPAIRAACDSDDEKAEFYFLDDPGDPLSLSWKLGDSDRLQVVKIDYVTEKASQAESSQLEQKLQQQEKVEIYGIYFDFASAEIRPQSKPTLDEIAAVMKAHPDWRLSVRGHTDNVGGDAFNLDLSKKRAESVKKALVEEYRIAPERLETDGFGASQPVDTNDTMEGRAKNRRVELSRL